jgi:hypothetical protein
MSEAQVLNLALTVIPMMTIVLVGILVNNVRISDLRDSVKSEILSLRDVLRAAMDKNHSEMLHRFADLDTRMTRIENSLGMNRG